MEEPKEPTTETDNLFTIADTTTNAADPTHEAENVPVHEDSSEILESAMDLPLGTQSGEPSAPQEEGVAALVEPAAVESEDCSDNAAPNSSEASLQVEDAILGEMAGVSFPAIELPEPIAEDTMEEPKEFTSDRNEISSSDSATPAAADTTHNADSTPVFKETIDNVEVVSSLPEDTQLHEPSAAQDNVALLEPGAVNLEDSTDSVASQLSMEASRQVEDEDMSGNTNVASSSALGSAEPTSKDTSNTAVAEDQFALATVTTPGMTVEELAKPRSDRPIEASSSTGMIPKPQREPPKKPPLSAEARQRLRERKREQRQRRAALTPSQRCIEDYERKVARETKTARAGALAEAAVARAAWHAELAARKIGRRPQRLVKLSLKVAAAPSALVARTLEVKLVLLILRQS